MHLAKKEKESKKLIKRQSLKGTKFPKGQRPEGTEMFPRDAAVPTTEKQPREKKLCESGNNFLAAFPIGVILQKESV